MFELVFTRWKAKKRRSALKLDVSLINFNFNFKENVALDLKMEVIARPLCHQATQIFEFLFE